mmetsp:Transcript_17901/g.24862  ORF Transcript_17901/g.24862 Transcript_17901/m.24862 type:complete len:425 (-) Transcript_17901:431-1705(-)
MIVRTAFQFSRNVEGIAPRLAVPIHGNKASCSTFQGVLTITSFRKFSSDASEGSKAAPNSSSYYKKWKKNCAPVSKKKKLALAENYKALVAKYPGEFIPGSQFDYFKETKKFERRTKPWHFKEDEMIKIATWNVASLRSLVEGRPYMLNYLTQGEKADIICLQETKLSSKTNPSVIGQLPGYTFFDSLSTERQGYSGTRTYVKDGFDATHFEGFLVRDGFAVDTCPHGRLVTSSIALPSERFPNVSKEMSAIKVVNTYVPTSGLDRETGKFPKLPQRLLWDEKLRGHLVNLKHGSASPPLPIPGGDAIIWTGDFNVMKDLDHYWKGDYGTMLQTPGFAFEERKSFDLTLKTSGMKDAFRHLYPNAAHSYTFWSHYEKGKYGNRGLRLDGFAVKNRYLPQVVDVYPLRQVLGSDHCPVIMWLKVV